MKNTIFKQKLYKKYLFAFAGDEKHLEHWKNFCLNYGIATELRKKYEVYYTFVQEPKIIRALALMFHADLWLEKKVKAEEGRILALQMARKFWRELPSEQFAGQKIELTEVEYLD